MGAAWLIPILRSWTEALQGVAEGAEDPAGPGGRLTLPRSLQTAVRHRNNHPGWGFMGGWVVHVSRAEEGHWL